jgi:YtkA-like
MSRLTTAALATAVLLLVPASSQAGGWATVGLSSMPDDARPGEQWVVDLTVLQHGVTPLEGVTPVVTIAPEETAGAKPRTFEGTPTKETGVYRARVDLPSKGVWDVSVNDGFGGVHEFGVVRMGDDGTTIAGGAKFNPVDRPNAAPSSAPAEPVASGSGSGIDLGLALLLAALAGLLAAGITTVRSRREGPSPASG